MVNRVRFMCLTSMHHRHVSMVSFIVAFGFFTAFTGRWKIYTDVFGAWVTNGDNCYLGFSCYLFEMTI